MRNTYLLPSLFPLLILIAISCQKELSLENVRETSMYSFNGATGSCTGAIVSGSFTAGTPVTGANTVTLTVNVDSIGSYIITTNTINGISFSGSGVFTSEGEQEITLTAKGTPLTAGSYDFKPVADGCTFSVTVASNNGGSSGTAVYSLNGGSAACTGAVLNGTFTAGTASSSANTAVLHIKVDQVGSYNISTNSVNGIKFTGTGSFTATGAQTVTLTASGTPVAAGNFSFITGSTGCSFNVIVGAASNPGSGTGSGTSGNFLRCKINGVLTNFNTALAGLDVAPPSPGIPYSITVMGKNSTVANSNEELWVSVSNATRPTTGSYSNLTVFSPMGDRGCQASFYPTGFPGMFWGSPGLNANSFTVNITSISSAGASGTFQGTLLEVNGLGPASKNITEGEFKISF